MSQVFRWKNNQPIVWYRKNRTNSNQFCLYCGRFIGEKSGIISNKEHLIGRDFVPRGSLTDGTQFNFIFGACKECNEHKAKYEQFISTFSLYNALEQIKNGEQATRVLKKARDHHPIQKGTPICESSGEMNIILKGGNFSLTVNSVFPPQVPPEYVRNLAFFHVQALFSLSTSINPLKASGTRLLPFNHFFFYNYYPYSDWGNVQLKTISKRAKELSTVVNIDTANGFFKAVLRRSEKVDGYWFWALEWNKYFRVVGGIYKPKGVPEIFQNLPKEKWTQMDETTRVKLEISFDKDDDFLFF